ncbi:hypothetical protein Glove_553g37 [Diversispora epigaea]|uniref:BTB domain-containing protein n=1 Tax=Diversispora epigaea TaxID=1348612 RepID=A0A397GJU4_9GLOM|nr:hypothetical protein Glove_553g37 [Diversispora epigaea]
MSLKFFDKLSQNFIELLNDKDDYNVIIEFKNEEKSFTAHSNILKYQSSYFRRELENIHPNENNIKTITISSISAQNFEIILKYIYGGIVNLENVETRFIFDLMLVTNEFKLEELNNELETHLIDTKASWLKTHFSFVYRTIFSKNNFKKLEYFCNNIVVKYPNLIFNADDFNFTSLPESALISLLERDDLQMKELMKSEIQLGLTKKILDELLWDEINQHLLYPERPVKSIVLPSRAVLVTELPPREPFSTIISALRAAEISTWIDHKKTIYSTTDIPYKFELILRGSRDGFDPQTFWNICHGHVSTVLVAKVKATDEIFGGYNPLAWDNSKTIGNKWMETEDSFIFSLKNGNIQNSILSRVKNPQCAIFNVYKSDQNGYGPQFGYDFHMRSYNSNNFTLDNDCYCRHFDGDYYKNPIRTTPKNNFSIVNYEVFKIVRKY